jgi:hypothetical protein
MSQSQVDIHKPLEINGTFSKYESSSPSSGTSLIVPWSPRVLLEYGGL